MKFAIHLRMSTIAQEDSPGTQRRLLMDWAERQGHEIVGEYLEEATSGGLKKERRPTFTRLLADAAAKDRPFDAILTLRRDRFGRDPEDRAAALKHLIRHNSPLWTPEGPVGFETPSEILYERISAAIDEHQRLITGLRVREHNQARAMQGKFPCGYAPLGLVYDPATQRIAPDDRAGDAILLFQAYIDCDGNASETARSLNARGLRTASGNVAFDGHAVTRILRNPLYRRCVHYAGRSTFAPELVPEIIPAELIDGVDRLLHESPARAPRTKASPDAYSGRLTCGNCGATFARRADRRNPHAPNGYLGYGCQNRRAGLCSASTFARTYLDILVGRALAHLIAELREERDAADFPAEEKPDRRAPHADALQRTRQRVINAYLDGNLMREEYLRRLADIDRRLTDMQHHAAPAPLPTADILPILEAFTPADWPHLAEHTRKALLAALHAAITIHSTTRPRAITLHTDFRDYHESFSR